MTRPLDPAFLARLQSAMAALAPRDPRFRYFQCRVCRTGFLWTTERFSDGKFGSAVLVPTGPGSRSGKPSAWRTTREVHVNTRKAAKARALRLYRQHHHMGADA